MVDWKRKEVRLPELSEPISHYTDAVRFGHLLFISGIMAVDAQNKLIGGPEDVAALAAFLASERAGWMTGAVIPVDSGYRSVGLKQ